MYQDKKPNAEEIERLINKYFQKKGMTDDDKMRRYDFIKFWLKKVPSKLTPDLELEKILLETQKKTT